MPRQAQHDQVSTDLRSAVPRSLWLSPAFYACLCLAAVVYGSLIPFDFSRTDASQHRANVWLAGLSVMTSPAWTAPAPGRSALGIPFSLSDPLFNLLLYVPVGVTLRLALRRRGFHPAVQVLAATLIALAVAWGVECLQSLVPQRVASRNDVAANSSGALFGALLAGLIWSAYKRAAFTCYCRLGRVVDRLRPWRDRPGVAMAIACINALIIGAWYLGELKRSAERFPQSAALPFERAFELPYDMSTLVLGQSLLIYAGIGCLLMLLTYTGTRRLAMNWVVLGVVTLAFLAELSRAISHDAVPDITGPLLALAAGTLMAVTVYTFSFAIKRANRRRRRQAHPGPERRRRTHEYV